MLDLGSRHDSKKNCGPKATTGSEKGLGHEKAGTKSLPCPSALGTVHGLIVGPLHSSFPRASG